MCCAAAVVPAIAAFTMPGPITGSTAGLTALRYAFERSEAIAGCTE